MRRRPGALIVVSHDRAFLDRVVTEVLELDEHTRTGRLFGGGWSGYLTERAVERAHAEEAYGVYASQRDELRQRRPTRAAVGHQGGRPREEVSPRQRQGAARLPRQPDREAGVTGPAHRAGAQRARSGGQAVGGLGTALQHQRDGPLGRGRRPARRGGARAGRLPPGTLHARHRLGRPGRPGRAERHRQDHPRRGHPRAPPPARGHPAHGTERGGGRAGPGQAPAARGRHPARGVPRRRPRDSGRIWPGPSWPSSAWAPRR